MPQLQSPDTALTATGSRTGSPATSTGTADSGTGSTAANGEREDLTVFFAIGVVVDVLLVTAFLAWAVGQWRKKK